MVVNIVFNMFPNNVAGGFSRIPLHFLTLLLRHSINMNPYTKKALFIKNQELIKNNYNK